MRQKRCKRCKRGLKEAIESVGTGEPRRMTTTVRSRKFFIFLRNNCRVDGGAARGNRRPLGPRSHPFSQCSGARLDRHARLRGFTLLRCSGSLRQPRFKLAVWRSLHRPLFFWTMTTTEEEPFVWEFLPSLSFSFPLECTAIV